jgi:hypothetical protein
MNYLQTLLENLKKEVSYQWRVQSRNQARTKAICSAYIDARDVMNVLDKHCTYGWQTDVKELAGFIFCGIGINIPLVETGEDEEYEMTIQTMWRWDTGSRIETDTKDNMYEQAGKAASSDAFKRAAVQWGVGRFLYDLPTQSFPIDPNGNVVDEQGQRVWDLTTYINNKKKGFTASTSSASFTVTNTAPPSIKATTTEAKELPPLPQEKLDNMLQFITEGKIAEVEKYSINAAQKKVLTSMINAEKARLVKESAKKK